MHNSIIFSHLAEHCTAASLRWDRVDLQALFRDRTRDGSLPDSDAELCLVLVLYASLLWGVRHVPATEVLLQRCRIAMQALRLPRTGRIRERVRLRTTVPDVLLQFRSVPARGDRSAACPTAGNHIDAAANTTRPSNPNQLRHTTARIDSPHDHPHIRTIPADLGATTTSNAYDDSNDDDALPTTRCQQCALIFPSPEQVHFPSNPIRFPQLRLFEYFISCLVSLISSLISLSFWLSLSSVQLIKSNYTQSTTRG